MGRGDKRSKRGKIAAGSYGKTRPKLKKKHVPSQATTTSTPAPKKATRKKKTE